MTDELLEDVEAEQSETPEIEGDEETVSEPELVTEEGLVDVEKIDDPKLRAAAEKINADLQETYSLLSESSDDSEDAEKFRQLVSNPTAVKYLYEQMYGSEETAEPEEEIVPEFEVDEEEYDLTDETGAINKKGLKKLVSDLAMHMELRTQHQVDNLMHQVSEMIEERLTPLASGVRQSQRNAAWQALLGTFPDAAEPETYAAIEDVLKSGRVGPDDFEAAYFVVKGAKTIRSDKTRKSSAASKKGKAAAAAATASARTKRVGNLTSSGGGWNAAVQQALKKLGSPST